MKNTNSKNQVYAVNYVEEQPDDYGNYFIIEEPIMITDNYKEAVALGNKIAKRKKFEKQAQEYIEGQLNTYDQDKAQITDWWGEDTRVIIRLFQLNKIYDSHEIYKAIKRK